MAILVDIGMPEWMQDAALGDILAPLLPGVPIRCGRPSAPLPGVTMLATVTPAPGIWPMLPDLRLVQKLGAGVNHILADPDLPPAVRVARLAPEGQAAEIAEYCLAMVLGHQRNLDFHAAEAAAGRWTPRPPRRAAETAVLVLGLGHIGARVAGLFAGMGFRTLGWSRRPKALDGVACHAGAGALPGLLGGADHVIVVLPSTPATRGMLDARLLAAMKPGAVLVNVGRGDLIVEPDLLAALDAGIPGHAVLDVVAREPLPADDPLWRHPRVTITPHVSGWHVGGGFADVAENYRRLTDGRPLLHEVDRAAGY